MNQLANSTPIVIDRPEGSANPRDPDVIYPFDTGYRENTKAGDGTGIDV